MIRRKKRSKTEMPARMPEINLPPVVINHTEINGMDGNQLFHVIMDVIFLLFGLVVLPASLMTGHFFTFILTVFLVASITARRLK